MIVGELHDHDVFVTLAQMFAEIMWTSLFLLKQSFSSMQI